MLFNSFLFVGFFVVVLPIYYALSHSWQNRFLIAASYLFYACWDWRFTFLLALSTVIDFTIGPLLESAKTPRRRRQLLCASLSVSLGILGFFKYFNFFVGSAVALLHELGVDANEPMLRVVLPVGVSFYTFQTMAYIIDIYRGKQKACRDFTTFALFVAYFPQLVAGPIERAAHLMPQLSAPRRVTQEHWVTGAQLILWGYVKKVAIADGLARYANTAFTDPGNMHGFDLWVGLYCFALQIYCDFSGYSDIARGISRLMGIELILNFRQPYLSRNITEFWRRWHMALSSWLRDYLYISLGGNQRGPARQYLNLLITMLLGGLWHGANWTFVAWGGLHGCYLAIHKRLTHGKKIAAEAPPENLREWMIFTLKAVATFHLVCLAWVFFRAPDMATAFQYIDGLLGSLLSLGLGDSAMPGAAITLLFYGLALALLDAGCWLQDSETPLTSRQAWWLRGTAYAAGLLILAFVRESHGQTFIYFQF